MYLYVFKNFISYKYILFFTLFTITGFLLFLFTSTSYEFTSTSIISQSSVYQYQDIYSSYLSFVNTSQETGSIFNSIFGFFSTIGFFLNRSEMWGLFFTRFNPTFMELMFGSGPMNFGQLYGEILINNPESLLLPHSSLLSLMLFIGLLPLSLLIFMLLIKLIQNRKNYEFVIISIYISINIFKNDSVNYLVVFFFYSFLFLILNKKRKISIF